MASSTPGDGPEIRKRIVDTAELLVQVAGTWPSQQELRETLSMPRSTFRYHLLILEREKRIERLNGGRVVRVLYPGGPERRTPGRAIRDLIIEAVALLHAERGVWPTEGDICSHLSITARECAMQVVVLVGAGRLIRLEDGRLRIAGPGPSTGDADYPAETPGA